MDAGGTTTWYRDALATLQLSELTDLGAVLPGVLARIDPSRLQVLA
jgi:hypothetical protein